MELTHQVSRISRDASLKSGVLIFSKGVTHQERGSNDGCVGSHARSALKVGKHGVTGG
jgi:hypothetical protein